MTSRTRQLHMKTERARWAQAAHNRVLQRINREPNSHPVQRVIHFLRQLQQAEKLRLQLYEATKTSSRFRVDTNYEVDPFGPEEYDSLDESDLGSYVRDIGEQLKRLRWTPTIHSFGEFYHLDVTYQWPQNADSWENWAILLLMRQIKGAGAVPAAILNFRQCRHCQMWFYARTDHQWHCSERCRKKMHSERPEFKAKRARYMKGYREVLGLRGDREGRRNRRKRKGA